jgi:hypothetical protein
MTVQTENLTQTPNTPGASRENWIPLAVREGMLSGTSYADECFVNQRFSDKLQAYLVSYVAVTTSGYGVLATALRN